MLKKIIISLYFTTSFVHAQNTVTDIDGNSYDYLTYGTQQWTVENSAMETYRDGTPIPQVTDATQWTNLTTGAWCYYDNDPTKGKLYNWYAVAGIHDNDPNTPNKEIAPVGWHVPTDAEWTTLIEHLIANSYNYDATTTGNKIAKAMASTSGWNSSTTVGSPGNNESLNNSSAFNALPIGIRSIDGSYSRRSLVSNFWTSSNFDNNNSWCSVIDYNKISLDLHNDNLPHGGKGDGYSVRFVKDNNSCSEVSISSSATEVCSGESVDLTVSSGLTAGTTACTSADLPANLQNGLVGYWPFCGNANDESGNGNDGTVNGVTLTTDRFGNTDSAFSFDENQYLVMNGSNIPTSTITLSVWVYQNNNFGQREYIALGGSSSCIWGVHADPNAVEMAYGIGCGGSGGSPLTTNDNYVGEWINFTYMSDGVGGNTQIYKNGIYIGQSNNSINTGSCSSSNLYLGVDIFSQPEYIDGKLDDLIIWNRALSPSEIQQLVSSSTYTWSTGDTTETITVTPTETTEYWVDVTTNGVTCREYITIDVTAPAAPTGDAEQTFCEASTVADLTATGENIQWYDAATGGNLLDATTSLTDGQIVYASQTVNGCESIDRLEVTVSIQDITITASATEVCSGESVDLTVSSGLTAGTTACVSSELPANLQNGLVGYWPFCGNANDESGNGNNGTVNGATLTTDRFGNADSAYNFDGNDWIDLGSVNLYDLTGGATISLVYKMSNSAGSNQLLLSHPNNEQHRIESSNNNIRFTINNGSWQSTLTQLNLDVWTLITGVFDNSDNKIKLYQNGVLINELSLSNTNFVSDPAHSRILLGGYFAGGTGSLIETYSGELDDIAIWNRALSETEIQQLANSSTYSWSTGDTTANISVTPTETTEYWVDVTTNGVTCREYITIDVTAPAAPTGDAQQTFCEASTVADLSATGDNIQWYDAATGGNLLDTSTALTDGQIVYASQTVNGCESTDRLAVTVSIQEITITASATEVCAGEEVTLNVNNLNSGPASSCYGYTNQIFSDWTELAPNAEYVNIIKHNNIYYLRSNNDVLQSDNINGSWVSMNFQNQIGHQCSPIATLFDFDWADRLQVATLHNSLYVYENGTWINNGLSGYGCSGRALTRLSNNRIIVSKWGYLRDLYISDDNGSNWTNVTNVDNDYRDIIVADNGTVFACGGSNTASMTGLIKSTDNGSSFFNISSELGINYASTLSDDCEGNLYVVADNSIYKSIDEGENWTLYSNTPFSSTVSYSFLLPISSEVLFLFGRNTNEVGLYESNNGGLTWQELTNPLSDLNTIRELKLIDNVLVILSDEGVFGKTIEFNTTTFLWSTGDTTETITVSPTETTEYWVDVTTNGVTCREYITIDVTAPEAPTGDAQQTFCEASTVADLTATGENIQWYDAATGGNLLDATTSLTDGQVLYASQVLNGCESTDRLEVTVTIQDVQITASATEICSGEEVTIGIEYEIPTICDMDITLTNIPFGDEIPGFTYAGFYNEHHYYVYNTPTSWTEGEQICRENGGYLVCINDEPENTFVSNLTNNNIWIGMFRDPDTCEFRWLDCIDITYTNWRPGEPNSGPCGEPYVQIIRGCSFGYNTWNNLSDNASNGACYSNMVPIMEIDPSIYEGNIITQSTFIWSTGDTTENITVTPNETTEYWVDVTTNGVTCREYITINVNDLPNIPVSNGDITECETTATQNLVATATVNTGESITWYDDATGGNIVTDPSLSNAGTVTYYAEAVNDTSGCVSLTRTAVTLTIESAPNAPENGGDITACETIAAQNLVATATVNSGESITWYDDSTGGNIVTDPSLNAAGTVTYYAEAVDDTSGCVSLTRTAVTLTIESAPNAPNSGGDITACETFAAQNLIATATVNTGESITWYDDATGVNIVADPSLSTAGTVTYYAEAINDISGCVSLTRTAVTLTITSVEAPTGDVVQSFCDSVTVADLSATGSNIQWYDAAIGGNNLDLNSALSDGQVLYASQVLNGCESITRLEVSVEIDIIPDPILITTELEFCLAKEATLADLEIDNKGFTLEWYDSFSGGNILPIDTSLENGVSYYATLYDVSSGCESLTRLEVVPTVIPCEVIIYNALSLNDDGKNDYMVIENIEYYPINTLEVYNRNGQLVFETDNYGQYNNYFYGKANVNGVVSPGSKLPTGSYLYVFKYFDSFLTQERVVLKGFLTINSN